MSDILTIAGSPSLNSRSAAVLAYARDFLQSYGLSTAAIQVRELDAEELLWGRYDGPSVRDGIAKVQAARAVIISQSGRPRLSSLGPSNQPLACGNG